MKNYHAEKTLFIERKTANKVRKKINSGGFVEDTSDIRLIKPEVSNFRIVIYHAALQDKVDKICGSDTNWVEKQM